VYIFSVCHIYILKLRKEIDRKYYLRNADKIRARNRESKAKKKQKFLLENQKYYGAESIKILLSIKGYTELSQQKYKL